MKIYLGLMVALLVTISPVFGQVSDRASEESPIPIPIQEPSTVEEEQNSRALRSFSSAVAWSERNRFGFSLSISEGYIDNVYPNSLTQHSSMLTAFSSGVFANFGRQNSRLHLDYGAGYRIYNEQNSMNGVDHDGTIAYTYQANRRTRFQLSNRISSSLNDPFSSFNPSLTPTGNWTPSPTYEVIFLPQRVTRNQAEARFDYDLTRSTHINAFGSYNTYWYDQQSFGDIHTVEAGAGLDQRITNWLSLSSTFSTYLSTVDERLRDYQIHRVEIGRFRFMLSRNVELFASGGIEMADTADRFRTAGMFRGGISRTSEKNVIYVNYQRTMTSALGFTRVLPSDLVSIGLGQRLTNRTNFRLSASYMRSSDFDYSGLLRGYYARGQFEYALLSNLFASISYTYQYQKNTIDALSGVPYFDRSIVFGSLQYSWPSIRLNRE